MFAAIVLAGLVAFAVARLTPPEFEATAQLYLAPASNPTVAFQDVGLGQSLARSYVALADAEVVLRPAMDQVGWPGALASFRNRVSVTQVRDTSIIDIRFRDSDPRRAALSANAIASTFITQSRELQNSLQGSTATELDQQIRAIQDDISSLDAQINALRATLSTSPSPGSAGTARGDLQNQVLVLDTSRQSKQQTLGNLLKTRDDMRLAQARAETAVSLWQPATVPESPVSPKILLSTLLGAVAGGLVALLGVGIVTYVDDRLTDVEDVRERLGIAPLGQVRLHARPETITGKLFLRDEPSSAEAEAIRGVRTNVLFAGIDLKPKTVLVTSALPGEGKSVMSANLALAFAETGSQVVLVDADLRRPSQHRLFKISASVGLTNLLTENLPGNDLQRFKVTDQLLVIPSGPLPPNPAELLASNRMTALLQHLAALAENALVIIDSSPALAVADPIALSTKVDGCVVVVDSSHTRVASTRRAVAALERVHARVLGVVLNKLAERETRYYRYGGYYGASVPPRRQSRGPREA